MTVLQVFAQGWLRHALLLVIVLALHACSGLPSTRPDSDERPPQNWRAVGQQLEQLTQWRLSARIGVQSRNQGGSMDMFWRQSGDHFDVRLIAPLGQGAIRLDGNAQQVRAQTADGRRYSGRPDELLQQHFDIAVPVASLPFWLRGLPAPDSDYEAPQWDERGRLQGFVQAGWKVEMRDHKAVGDYRLPHRFYLEPVDDAADAEGGETSVRLLVRQWVLAQ